MKKFFMTLVAAVMIAASADAQVYLGGSFGVGSTKIGDGDNVTTYQVLPEVGYNINNDWAVGTVLGFGKGKPTEIQGESSNYFKVEPYVRYTFVHSKYVNVFSDLGFGYTHYNHAGNALGASVNAWEVGVRPGVAVNLNKHLSFVSHIGFLGYKTEKADLDHAKASNAWGVDLDGNNVTFGLYYNF